MPIPTKLKATQHHQNTDNEEEKYNKNTQEEPAQHIQTIVTSEEVLTSSPVKHYIIPEHTPLKQSLLDLTKDFLERRGRRYFGQAAVSLENQLNDPKYASMGVNKKLISSGIAGEKSTSKELMKWVKDKPAVVLIDSLHLPIKTGNEEMDKDELDEETGEVLSLGDTDHILIIGDCLFIIDSKNWKAKTSYSITEKGEVLRYNKPFPGNKPKMNQTKYLWKMFYKDFQLGHIEGFVCISNNTSNVIRNLDWWRPGFKLVNQEHLIYFLDKIYKDRELNKVDYIRVDLVAKALTGLQKPYDSFREKFPDAYRHLNGNNNKKRG